MFLTQPELGTLVALLKNVAITSLQMPGVPELEEGTLLLSKLEAAASAIEQCSPTFFSNVGGFLLHVNVKLVTYLRGPTAE